MVLVVKNSPAKAGGIRDVGWIPGWEDPLKKCMTSNQSILKEINPGISLEGMMLKLKLQYFGQLMEELTHWKRL